ncbi:hypothetical protein EKH57_12570 [Halorubrum sp. BOL3-1]|uniref:hypothetical protein n=1 Tax=Halorubrum sp. BOL3-1 TaxID=2497325 RepID=UPI001005254E|nr:hypothetical protein [Halorubrum sp. BOL3-1]QAU13478.1 hypothetical protein EKH57_12570 [Halorubrum sp. BOL3-1]
MTEAAQPPAEGVQHVGSIAGATYTVDKLCSAEELVATPANSETLTIGGRTERTIEIRHLATERYLEISPESETTLLFDHVHP